MVLLVSFERLTFILIWPNHHGSISIFYLLCAAVVVRSISCASSEPLGVALFLYFAAALTVFSDGLALIVLWNPLVIICGKEVCFGPSPRKKVLLSLPIVLGSGQGVATLFLLREFGWLNFESSKLLPGIPILLETYAKFPGVVAQWLLESWILHLLILVCMFRFARIRTPESKEVKLLRQTLFLSVGVCLVVAFFMGRLGSIYSIRYVQHYFLFTSILVTIRVSAFSKLSPALALVTIALFSFSAGLFFTDLQIIKYPEATRCVDDYTSRTGFRRGLSDYWTAKLVSFTTRNGSVVDQVLPDLKPYLLMNAKGWYNQGAYNFVVLPPPPHEQFQLDALPAGELKWTCGAGFRIFEFAEPYEIPE